MQRKRGFMRAYSSLCCALLIVACDGEEVAFEDLPTELASAACDAYQDCGAGYALPAPLGSDGCDAYFASVYRNLVLPSYEAAIDAGTIAYDADAAADCLAQYDELGCGLLGGSGF